MLHDRELNCDHLDVTEGRSGVAFRLAREGVIYPLFDVCQHTTSAFGLFARLDDRRFGVDGVWRMTFIYVIFRLRWLVA